MMSSGKGVGSPYNAAATNGSPMEQGISEDKSLGFVEGGWEVGSRKTNNRAGTSAAKYVIPHNSKYKGLGHQNSQKVGTRGYGRGSGKGPSCSGRPTQTADSRRPIGRGNIGNEPTNRSIASDYDASSPATRPLLENGSKWKLKSASSLFPEGRKEDRSSPLDAQDLNINEDENEASDKDEINESDDELLSDDYDSDESLKSHGTRKMSKWFCSFFEELDTLTIEQVNDVGRRRHCPACRRGPGEIFWYYGMQALMTHAKTKGSRRVRLHREFAEILEEELVRKGTNLVPAGEVFGKWKGLSEVTVDKEIVWPPMVVIMNSRLDKDDKGKWTGMGSPELLQCFRTYDAVKAKHAYGPNGHLGMSLLIFEASAVGYLEAERLSNHFEDEGTDRESWVSRRMQFSAGAKRQLYGYLAEKRDMNVFNQHCHGTKRLKFEMKSYQGMVVRQLKQMSEDNQELLWHKNIANTAQRHSKALEESLGFVSDKLRKTSEETSIVRERTKMHHQQNKEEMDSLEEFFKDQITIIQEVRGAKEENFERIQQDERGKVKQFYEKNSTVEDPRRRAEEFSKFIISQDKEMDKFVEEKEMLMKTHEERRVELKRRYLMEEVELEERLNVELNQLMEKFTPYHPQG